MSGTETPAAETPSPRPWRVNPEWSSHTGMGLMPSPILDADGKDVLPVSEWISASDADIALIVAAVNAMEPANG